MTKTKVASKPKRRSSIAPTVEPLQAPWSPGELNSQTLLKFLGFKVQASPDPAYHVVATTSSKMVQVFLKPDGFMMEDERKALTGWAKSLEGPHIDLHSLLQERLLSKWSAPCSP